MAETTLQRLVRVHAYVRTEAFAMRDRGSQYLGRIQTYGTAAESADFTRKFKVILETLEAWGVAATKMEHEGSSDTDRDKVSESGVKLGNAIRDFNRSAWWASPSKARTLIAAPFQVAAAVAKDIGDILQAVGWQAIGIVKNIPLILAAAAVLYFVGPALIKAFAEGGKVGKPDAA